MSSFQTKEELQTALLAIDSSNLVREKSDRAAMLVDKTKLFAVMNVLKNDEKFSFNFLSAHTAVDYLAKNTIELVYELYSTVHGFYAQVSCEIDRNECLQKPLIDSVSRLWAIAEWHEREVYDMFGVLYANHPDLRRILLDDDWVGHPLRKDYKDDFMLERPW